MAAAFIRTLILAGLLALAFASLVSSVVPAGAQSINPQSVMYNNERWSFGAYGSDGVNAQVLRNGTHVVDYDPAGWYGHILQVGSDGKLYLMGMTTWWVWNGSGFQESGGPPHAEIPGVPPGAASAGYNTLALDSDFSKPLPANWLGGCHQAGNGQAVDNNDIHGHTWFLNIWWAKNYQPCRTAQRTINGELVLDMPWIVDPAHAAYGTTIESAAWTQGGDVHDFPHSSYYEITARMAPANVAGAFFGFHTWGTGGVYDQSCACVIEWDVEEVSDSDRMRMDSAVHNWGSGGGGWVLYPWRDQDLATGTNLDPAKYNTYGMRITYDGTKAVGCTYINNVFQKCAETAVGGNEPGLSGRNALVLLSACDHWNGPCQPGLDQHLYVKAIRVWSCADWQTSHCPRGLMYSAS